MVKTNDLVLKTATTMLVFLILGFSVYLLFAGHNNPGGGFIGGLMASAGIVLLYVAYGFKTMDQVIGINFRKLFAAGLALALLTGIGSFLFNVPFLSHTFGYFTIPIFGEVELATAMLFDMGVYLTVIGVTLTIILTIADDAK